MTAIRGKINNRDRAKQLRDFSGLRFGNITPTDIDGFCPLQGLTEYHNKGYIFVETKLNNAPFEGGQRLAFERLTDDLNRIKPTVYIIASHDKEDPNEDIDVANAMVKEYRFKGKWQVPNIQYTVRDLTKLFIDKVLDDNLG